MTERKPPSADDPLARLTPIEAPEFLDRLVLEQGLRLLQAQPLLRAHATLEAATSRSEAPRTEPRLRWALPRLKSS